MSIFPDAEQSTVTVDAGVDINVFVGGSGPPLLLLHGHPETHITWRKVFPALAERFTLVVPDMRGYGDSSKPDSHGDHEPYSKRVMANDQVQVMHQLGFDAFQCVGHDRGGRVLHRMLLDHPQTVSRGVVLDIAPTDLMYAETTEAFATRYFWWFFHIQGEPLPEAMIGSQVELYLRSHLDAQSKTPGAIDDEAFAEYLRCYTLPGCIHAVCEDYRASVGIDRDHIRADEHAGRRVTQPLTAYWGAKGTVGQLFDVLGLWRREAEHVDGEAIDCGHLIPEEAPDQLVAKLLDTLDA